MKNIFVILLLVLCIPAAAKTAWFRGGSSADAALKKAFAAEGFRTADVASLSGFSGEKDDVLVLENCQYFPGEGVEAFNAFIQKGGGLLAIGGIPFSEMTVRLEGRDVPLSEASRLVSDGEGETLADPASPGAVSRFSVTSCNSLPGRHFDTAVSEGRPAFHIHNDGADSWESYTASLPELSVPESPLFSVSIKGSRYSPTLSLGIREKDGSRWFRHISLSDKWETYIISPGDFGMWDNSRDGRRGGPGDSPDPGNLASFEFAIMSAVQEEEDYPSSTPTGKPQDIYIGEVKLIPGALLSGIRRPMEMPAFSPAIHMYRASADTVTFEGGSIEAEEVVMPFYRNRGYGLDNKGAFRQVPLAFCMEKDREKGMAAQAIYHREDSAFHGATWVYAGVDPGLLTEAFIERLTECFVPKPRFLCAGTSRFSYMPGERIDVGAKTVKGEGDSVVIRIKDEPWNEVFAREVKPGETASLFLSEPGFYTAELELFSGGVRTDRMVQDFSVFDPDSRTWDNIVRSEEGHLWLGDDKWVPSGVNYWPMYAVGVPLRTAEGGGAWLAADEYLPDRIEADLRLLSDMDINAVSTQYLRISEAPQLRDFLERCQKYGIKVHLFLEGCHPLALREETAASLVKAACLDRARAMFCYDLGWEVSLGGEASRASLNGKWNEWLTREYGSPETAFTVLGYTPSITNGYYNGPTDSQIRTPDKKSLAFIGAWRRFLDDLIGKGLQRSVRNLRKYDPYTLMGLRNGAGGNGTVVYAHIFPYDMKAGARHLDILCPEGYNLGATPLFMGMGELTNLHCRLVSGGKPVVWIEYGAYLLLGNTPDNYSQEAALKKLQYQTNYYRIMADFVARSSATGSFAWWYPGGYRLDERSDYGIAEPDLTPRGALLAIRDRAADQLAGDVWPREADETLIYDRDLYARGYGDFFEKNARHVSERLLEGKYTGLATPGTGLTTRALKPEGVGNIPYRGIGPVKYLDSEMDSIRCGSETLIESGTLRPRPGARFTVVMANTDDCLWENEGEGRVRLRVSWDSGEAFYPLDRRAGYLETARASFVLKGRPSRIRIRLCADKTGPFGEEAELELDWQK
ncbi:MAG: hypothetical protein IJT95_01795 [Abditibacteriota bacterium]|nr:hypothetical protein [Abditibacteriota bacterium]